MNYLPGLLPGTLPSGNRLAKDQQGWDSLALDTFANVRISPSMYLVMLSGSSPIPSVKEEEEEIMNRTDIYLIIHEELERKGKRRKV